jgi:hypothetical protein
MQFTVAYKEKRKVMLFFKEWYSKYLLLHLKKKTSSLKSEERYSKFICGTNDGLVFPYSRIFAHSRIISPSVQ